MARSFFGTDRINCGSSSTLDNQTEAWRDYADAMQRLSTAQARLTKLAERVDAARDDHTQAIADAADALRRVALPLDRHAA